MQNIGQEILQDSIGKIPTNKNFKKVLTSFGEIEVPHTHCLNRSGGRFKISSYFQQMICYVGQNEVFEESRETIKRLRGVEINGKQIERVCHHYGEELRKN